MNYAIQVHIDQVLPVPDIRVLHQGTQPDSGVVTHQVYGAKTCNRRIAQCFHRCQAGHIHGAGHGLRTEISGNRLRLVNIDIGQHHVHTRIDRSTGYTFTNTGTGPGDHSHLVL